MDRQLIDYFPSVLSEYQEIKALADAEQPEIDQLLQSSDVVLAASFVDSADEAGVERFEKLLWISPKIDETLDDRRFNIVLRMSEQRPFTASQLALQLAALCGADGYKFSVDNINYSMFVGVELTAKNNLAGVESLLKRIVPANMVFELSLLYKPYGYFTPFTNAQMAAFTHYQLRNEVTL